MTAKKLQITKVNIPLHEEEMRIPKILLEWLNWKSKLQESLPRWNNCPIMQLTGIFK